MFEDLIRVHQLPQLVEHHNQNIPPIITIAAYHRALPFWFIFFIVELMMRFEGKASEHAALPTAQQRTIDVILLRDNRDGSKEKRAAFDPRCSAFKETEADPLEERFSEGVHSQEALEELIQRVTRLEERVQLLQEHRETMAGPAPSGRKRRRRFEEMQRDIECVACRKSYGSETALKYHCKLKHGGLPQ